MSSRLTLSACALALSLSPAALATQYAWNWAGAGSVSNAGGTFQSIHAEYNTATKRFLWDATFSTRNTQGFTLAVNRGPNPNGTAGQLALLYFDATTLASPKVTAYGYNGQNSSNSWQDGTLALTGNQTPDLIFGSTNTSWIYQASVQDVGASSRRFILDINATNINNHTPLYPDSSAVGGWIGLEFLSQIGMWFHTYSGLTTSYSSGALSSWNFTGNGYLDGTGQGTYIVTPLPTTAGLGLVGVGGLALRRRRAN